MEDPPATDETENTSPQSQARSPTTPPRERSRDRPDKNSNEGGGFNFITGKSLPLQKRETPQLVSIKQERTQEQESSSFATQFDSTHDARAQSTKAVFTAGETQALLSLFERTGGPRDAGDSNLMWYFS